MAEQKTIDRSVALKSISYVVTQDHPEPDQPLHELLKELWDKAPLVSNRHHPILDPESPFEDGTRCCFCDQLHEIDGIEGAMFRINAYEQGRQPTGLKDAFDQKDADSSATTIYDPETDDPMHMVFQGSLLIWNRIALIEHVQGTGGDSSIGHYLTRMIRRYVLANMPEVKLNEVVPPSIMNQIVAGGGVKLAEITAEPGKHESRKKGNFAGPLRSMMNKSRNPKWAKLIIKPADGELHDDTVGELLDDYEDGLISMVGFELKKGGKVRGDQLKFRRKITVSCGADRRPERRQLEHEMFKLFQSLKRPNISKNGKKSSDDDQYMIEADGTIRSAT